MARQRKRKGDPVHGWIALDKPLEITSTQCVGVLKRLYNAQKVGHGGTLDPLASGILPIAFGEATKTVAWAMDGEKDYEFTIEWGKSTATQDREGEITGTSDVRPCPEAVAEALKGFVGEIEQVPPKFSAIKVDGQRAYDLAREGEDFELQSRTVDVFEAAVVDAPDADHVTIRVCTGKGFYVRALARDLAFDLGAEGHISVLRRTRVGPFDEASAIPLGALEAMQSKDDLFEALSPVETAMTDTPLLAVTSDDAAQLKQGRAIVLLPHVVEQWRSERSDDPDDRLALAMNGDVAVALGDVRAGRFQPVRVFQI